MRHSLLQARAITKRFGGIRALVDVDLHVDEDEILGLIGPNGSGKTTLANCITGFYRPTQGTVIFDGCEITQWSRARRARAGLLRTFQTVRLFDDLTVYENVRVGVFARAKRRGGPELSEVLERFELASVARVATGQLSYGTRRRVELARTLVGRPEMLVLDEPGAGLTEPERSELRNLLLDTRSQHGCAMLVIDHDVNLITQLCDRVAVLHEGQVIFMGSPGDAVQDQGVITAYLGTMNVRRHSSQS